MSGLINDLSLLRRKEFTITEDITVFQPTLGEIEEYGEEKYYYLVSLLTATPSDVKSMLLDKYQIDYEEISEFELFIMFTRNITVDESKILLGDIDLSKLSVLLDKRTNELVLCKLDQNNEPTIVLNSFIYNMVVDRLREIHQFKKNTERAYNEHTKRALINEDREKNKEKKEFKSILAPLILASVCCSSFPYDFSTVWDVPIGLFLKGIPQIQKYNNVNHLMAGIYSGNIDATKISKKDMSWF